ncbi:pseudouridine synthase [Persicitalea jodogahamensis]|uniref:Pseudouridine synthase n=1 Tax=Persicitalea jodogahamensis TaxID=402147 RepID=A0A8J3D639_9BACT|nr:pseudouridine synthase [Persicitalea jodogahamensis]GHB58065.1 pseudouridine synthase [Persicitalea jodogahamensis]
MHQYFLLNKPYDMLSQFIGGQGRMLGELDYDFPEGTHPIGRLDNHSEGLLILTTNKKVTKLLFQSKVPHRRTYLVRVYREVSAETLGKLRTGVTIRIKGNVDYVTTPCEVELVKEPENLFPGGYQYHEGIPHSWLRITLTEGKYHQIRKMTRVVGHPCQRLIRTSIEGLELGSLLPGEMKEIEEEAFFEKLGIAYSGSQ